MQVPRRAHNLLLQLRQLGRLIALRRLLLLLALLFGFPGLPLPEVAQLLGISPRTADRLWAYARAWLHQEIHGGSANADTS